VCLCWCRKTRVWLGTYETAEDEAARLISGPAARTNFPSTGGALSPTLRAKLEKCCAASTTTARQDGANASTTAEERRQDEEEAKDENDEDYIEEMIKELTYHGPIEML
jgi:hypothetical protein